MPILPQEPDCLPVDLFDREDLAAQPWWLMYTHSRKEKALLRDLRREDVPHYCPIIKKRQRSPAGRIRISFVPLFSNYVFVMGGETARYRAICTGCVLKACPIMETDELVEDLRQIKSLIEMDVPLTIESKLEAGEHVRVRNGAFAGYEGTILRRENETRLLVAVRFMEQGVSVHLEDCQLEAV